VPSPGGQDEFTDLAAAAELLTEDVRATMPPYPMWHFGRDTLVAALAASWNPDLPGYVGRFRMLPTAANRQPAAAAYVRT
jgi:RNA polymerase sigma-70 factor (ECF subfamily)